MSAKVTVETSVDRLEYLRKQASAKQEFDGKDFNSMKSIITQIEQSNLLTDLNKTLIILQLMAYIEDKVTNEN